MSNILTSLGKKLDGQRSVLLICLLISLVLWTISKMSKTYDYAFDQVVKFEIPNDRALAVPVPQKIRADVRAKGWNLLTHSVFNRKDTAFISIGQRAERVISESEIRRNLIDHLTKDQIDVVRVFPDHIDLRLEDKEAKELPVVIDVKIRVTGQTNTMEKPPYLFPATVIATGPASNIQKLDTMKLSIEDTLLLADDYQQYIPIPKENYPLVTFNIDQVELNVEIENATQKEWLVPISVRGVDSNLTLLPDKVVVKGRIGLSKYDAVNPMDFNFYVDLREKQPDNEVLVEFDRMPPDVTYISHSPKMVEYYLKTDTIGN